ncbi:LOW QUALITY PROTEIN: A disintegrin and metalloproteinase with thrombospondin motifs 7 [Pipistrellus kuhlii]|uniref:LOW QUALITY PROTEIN: A disintegrin and metalloproteinase with thrombospondin motifs 7 n=1 Tax=Pipistrellus kuhlii TaxID=59472 RepID=UPI001E26EC46|nr:LOW QUALITY PROTEIN: A disintegrin and metalloproteinase with thrombospondin motifs 7 [Pipistrellus kuhlii]
MARPGPRAPRRPLLLLLLLCALAPGAPRTSPGPSTRPEEAAPQADAARDIVHPVRVDAGGAFLSFELWPRALRKRTAEAGAGAGVAFAHYRLRLRGQDLRLHLGAAPDLLAPGFVSETRRRGGLGAARIRRPAPPACHLQGRVQGAARGGGPAAISACDGLKGVFRLNDQDYFIEPLRDAQAEPGGAQPHVVYQRPASQGRAEQGSPRIGGTCGVQAPQERAFWQRAEGGQPKRQAKRQRRFQSSDSREKWVETLLVADADMVRHHGQPQVESYVLTLMNMVAGIFKNPSIGNPIHITVVRLIVLQDEVSDMKVQHEAHSTLSTFCEWQKRLNMEEDSHPLHHDMAVLITRKDLCTSRNQPCETLGLAHVGGICQPHLSCSITEDTGLPTAYTMAHEIGHSLGILHDGAGNQCHPQAPQLYIMSPQLLYNSMPLNWSQCSRDYITRFLDRGFGACLDDPPAQDVIPQPALLPGALYDLNHQCRLQYGDGSAHCSDLGDPCGVLWCSELLSCHTKKDPVVDGTPCGDQKWCLGGQCVSADLQPQVVDGGWSGWTAWSACSRSCGAGVQSSERQCTEPAPKNRGRFCVGERRRVRLCNVQGCAPGSPSFRAVQCGQFDATPYRGRLYKWVPQPTDQAPCELHCKPEGESFSDRFRDAVLDGTPCYEGRRGNRDVCIDGICQNVGCDFQINSGAVEDRCGVCRGNGSTCHTVSWVFQEHAPLGYVDVGQIPAGAREILIKELVPSGNFLVLRGQDAGRHHLNGQWSIRHQGAHPIAGTVFTYVRDGHLERLTAPGPTNESLWIQMLFYEANRGLYYEYTIQRDAIPPGVATEFSWAYGAWTDCPVTCGKGVQRQVAYCTERHYGTVDNRYCESLGPPEERQRMCVRDLCPPRWWASDWQACSQSCGPGGFRRRTVYCLRSLGLGTFADMLPADCGDAPAPPAVQPCSQHVPCPSRWAFGQWTPCSATCGPGVIRRAVACTQDAGVPCDEAERPPGQAPCLLRPCLQPLDVPQGPEGSGSGGGGGGPLGQELDNEVDSPPRPPARQPPPPGAALPTEPPGPGNAIHQARPELGPPGPAVVDDFYYDYNFIRFHENLAGDGDEDGDGDENGGPGLHPSPSPPPQSGPSEPPAPAGRTPWDPLLNFLPEEDAPTGTPPPAPEGHTPATPGTPEAPPPRWESTNEVPEEDEGDPPGPFLLPGFPEAPPRPPARPSPQPGPEALWPAVGGVPPAAPLPQAPPGPAPGAPPPGNASWEAGDWSQCSTTCGLGASWRAVRCSSGREEDCAPEGRPQPARRCHLRPCAAWRAGNWSKCSQGCGGGASVRDVQCVDARDLRPLRPFHCQPGPAPPPARRPCGSQPCLSWYTSSWRECSEACGGGEQHRLVTCPEPGLCPEALRPNATRPCNTHPCTQWAVGPWGECSAPCGGGVQRRVIRCVNTHRGLPEEDSGRCAHAPWPASARPCGTQACEVSEQRQGCEQDQLPFGSCERLRLLARCRLPSIRAQCCLTCRG